MARLLSMVALALASLGCAGCPPDWADQVARHDGYHYAAASVGELTVDIDPVDLALIRAARRLADALGLDVEGRLSVTRDGEFLFVEARSSRAAGGLAVEDLAGLELVEVARCGTRTHAQVRLPVR